MMALRANAEHVTAVDRWLYMALACKESLVNAAPFINLFENQQYPSNNLYGQQAVSEQNVPLLQ